MIDEDENKAVINVGCQNNDNWKINETLEIIKLF